MSEFIPKINGEKIENRNVGSSEVKPPVEGSEKFPVFEFTPMPDFTFDYGDEYVAHTKINQVPTKLTMNLNTGKISAGYRADDITLSKIVDRTTEAAGLVIEEGAKKAAEGVGQVCSDVADYMAPKFQAIGDAWYYSDIGALCRGDFKKAWEINRDQYFKPVANGEFSEALSNFGKGNKALSTAVGLEMAKDVAGGDAIRTSYHAAKNAVDDGDPNTLTAGERALSFVGATGEFVDEILTPVGIVTTMAAPGALSAAGTSLRAGSNAVANTLAQKGATALASTVRLAPEAVTLGAKVAGGTMVASGTSQVLMADTEQGVKEGTQTIFNGAMLYGAANAVGKSADVLTTETPAPVAKNSKPSKKPAESVEAAKQEVVKTPREKLVAETAERLEWNKGVLERAEANYQAQTKALKKTIREGSPAEQAAAKRQLKIEQENIKAARTSFKAEQNRVSQSVKNAVKENPELAIKGEKGNFVEKNIVKEANTLNNQKAKAVAEAKKVKPTAQFKPAETPISEGTAKPSEQPEVKFTTEEETLLKKYDGTNKNAEYWEKRVKDDIENVEFCKKNPAEGGPVEDAIKQLNDSKIKAQKFREQANELKKSIPDEKLKAWEAKQAEAKRLAEQPKNTEPAKVAEKAETPIEEAKQNVVDAKKELNQAKDNIRTEKAKNAKEVKDLTESAKRIEDSVKKLEKTQDSDINTAKKNYEKSVKEIKNSEADTIKKAKEKLEDIHKKAELEAQRKAQRKIDDLKKELKAKEDSLKKLQKEKDGVTKTKNQIEKEAQAKFKAEQEKIDAEYNAKLAEKNAEIAKLNEKITSEKVKADKAVAAEKVNAEAKIKNLNKQLEELRTQVRTQQASRQLEIDKITAEKNARIAEAESARTAAKQKVSELTQEVSGLKQKVKTYETEAKNLKAALEKRTKASETEIGEIQKKAAEKINEARKNAADEIKAVRKDAQAEIAKLKGNYEKTINSIKAENGELIEALKKEIIDTRKMAEEKVAAGKKENVELKEKLEASEKKVKALEEKLARLKLEAKPEPPKAPVTSALIGGDIAGSAEDKNEKQQVKTVVTPSVSEETSVNSSVKADKTAPEVKTPSEVKAAQVVKTSDKNSSKVKITEKPSKVISSPKTKKSQTAKTESYVSYPSANRRISFVRNTDFSRLSLVGRDDFRTYYSKNQNQRLNINPQQYLNAVIDLLIKYVENLIVNILRMLGI